MKLVFLIALILLTVALPQTLKNHRKPKISRFHRRSLRKIGELLLTKLTATPRFSEIPSQTSFFNEIPFVSADANSTFYQGKALYPASNAIGLNPGYWCSKGSHPPSEVVYLQVDFPAKTAVSTLMIKWAYAPTFYAIQGSENGKDYRFLVPWRDCVDSAAHRAFLDAFYWWKWRKSSFVEVVSLGTGTAVKSIRILMRRPANRFFGIYSVQAFERKRAFFLRTVDSGLCLLNREGNPVLQDCTKDIAFPLYRTLFTLEGRDLIETLSNDKERNRRDCLGFSAKTTVFFGPCPSESPRGEDRYSWDLTQNGSLLLLNSSDPARCLCSKPETSSILPSSSLQITSTSTMSDGQHNPELAVSSGNPGFWASNPGDKDVHFLVRFQETQLRRIRIRWRFVPKDYTIEGFFNSLVWREILSHSENTNSEEIIDQSLDLISGIRVVLRASNARFNDLVVYGIEDFELQSQFLGVELGECGRTHWQTEEIDGDLSENESGLKRYIEGIGDLYRKVGQMRDLKPLVDQGMERAKALIDRGSRTKVRIEGLIESISKLNRKTRSFVTANLQPEFEERQARKARSQLGTIESRPIQDCETLKRLYPRKRTGFYWVKPSCSPSPIRILCYLSSTKPLNYHFLPKLQTQLSSLNEISQKCAEIGLFPVEVTTAKALNSLKFAVSRFFRNKEVKFPIAVTLKKHVASLIAPSFVSLDELRPLDKDFEVQGFVPREKTVFLSQNLEVFSLDDPLFPGLICSSNGKRPAEYDESGFIMLKCTDSVNENRDFNYGSPQNARFKVRCPSNCRDFLGKTAIWGKDRYKSDSSICLAAIHSGVLENGGFAKIAIFEDKSMTFPGSEENGIESLEWTAGWDRYFTIERYELRCPREQKIKAKGEVFRFSDLDHIEGLAVDSEKIEDTQPLYSENNPGGLDPNTVKNGEIEDFFKEKRRGIDYFTQLSSNLSVNFSRFSAFLSSKSNTEFLPSTLEALLSTPELSLKNLEKQLAETLQLSKRKLGQKRAKKRSLTQEKAGYSSTVELCSSGVLPDYWGFLRETQDFNWTCEGSSGGLSVSQGAESIAAPSVLLLRNQKVYDFRLTLAFRSLGKGNIGLFFRYRDPFNYYLLELSRPNNELSTQKGGKKLLKANNGVLTELFSAEDGGFIENSRVNIEVLAQMDAIHVRIIEKAGFSETPFVFEVSDGDLVYGTVGLRVSNLSLSVIFEEFSLVKLACQQLRPESKSEVIYQPGTCSRFKEKYRASFDYTWKAEPGWRVINLENNGKAIVQDRLAPKPDQLPSILELRIDKVCFIGLIRARILVRDPGSYSGVAFLYSKKTSAFYSFELHLTEESTVVCRLRRFQSGRPLLLIENIQLCGQIVRANEFTSVSISLSEQKVSVSIGPDPRRSIVIDQKIERSSEDGGIALLTNGGIGAFSEVEMGPAEDFETSELPIVRPQNEGRKYGVCESAGSEERSRFCQQRLGHKCEKDWEFCPRCCQAEFPHNSLACQRKCKETVVFETQDRAWRDCVENQEVENSRTFRECEKAELTLTQRVRCKRDLCEMCCLRGKARIFGPSNNTKCLIACAMNYATPR